MHKPARKDLSFLTLFIVFVLLGNPQARATTYTINASQAGPLAVSSGDVVTITGTGSLNTTGGNTNSGVQGGSSDNVTVTVQNGGQVTAEGRALGGSFAGKAIYLGNNASITVDAGGLVKNLGKDPNGSGAIAANAIYTGDNATINVAGTVLTDKQAGLWNNWSQGISVGSGSTITVGGSGVVSSTTFGGQSVRFRSGSGNVLNLYGNASLNQDVGNEGTAGGAIINFGYTGTAADSFANTTITGSVAENAWNAHVYGGTNTITGNAGFSTLQVDAGTILNVNDTYTQASGTTLIEGISSSTSYGKIVTPNTAIVSSSSLVHVNVTGYVDNNSTYKVVDTAGNGIGNLPEVNSSSPWVTFTAAATGGNLVLTASNPGLTSTTTSDPNTHNVATVLDQVSNPSSSPFSGTINHLYSTTSSNQLNNSLNSLASHFNNSVPQVSKNTLDKFVATTIASHSNVSVPSGVSTGSDMLKQVSLWAEGFGGYLRQQAQQLSSGYNATIGGMVFGVEKEISDLWKIGFSQGLSQEVIHGNDFSNNTNTNSYQSSIYGIYTKDAYYLNSAVSFGYNRYHGSRSINDGVSNMTATSNIDGEQYSTYLEGGYTLNHGNWKITPLASFEYMKLYIPDYTEKGAGALNLHLSSTDYNSAQTGLGFKLGYPVEISSGRLLPEFKFKWLHDWVGDPMENTATFSGGGASFNTVGFTPDRNTYELGAKLTFFTRKNVTISLDYSLDLRNNFQGNVGYVNVTYSF